MKKPAAIIAFTAIAIAVVTAAVFAAAPQSKRPAQTLTIKSNGKSIAVLRVELLGDAPVEVESSKSAAMDRSPRGTTTYTGGVKFRYRPAGERLGFEINADEIEMQDERLGK